MEQNHSLSRRNFFAVGAAGAVVTAVSAANATSFGNPDQPAEGAVNVTNPKARWPTPVRKTWAQQLLCWSLFWHVLDIVWVGGLTLVYLMAD